MAGGGGGYIIMRHLLPNSMTPIIVALTFGIPTAIFIEASLSFVGVGIRPPQPSWGSMIYDGAPVVMQSAWTAAVAIACVIVTVLAASTLGDALRDRFDSRGTDAG